MPVPSYLAKDRHGGFLFRISIPKSLRSRFGGKHSIRKSLRTYHRPTALREARKLAVKQEEIFLMAKKDYEEKLKTARDKTDASAAALNEMLMTMILDDSFTAEELSEGLLSDGTPNMDTTGGVFFSLFNLLESKGEEQRQTAKEMSIAIEYAEQIENQQLREKVLKMVQADYGIKPEEASGLAPLQLSTASSQPLSELWEEFRSSKVRSRKWKDDTPSQQRKIKEYDAYFRDCLAILEGDPLISEWNRQLTRKVVEGLLKLPKNYTKLYPNIPLNEIPESAEKVSASTASQRLDTIKAFFTFLEAEEFATKNWFANEKIERGSTNHPTPSKLDIQEWFNLPAALVDEPWKFWIPRIALFSGARQNEIAQLKVADIAQDPETKIWFFTIHNGDQNSTKSAAANRTVPLHSQLIEHGFLDYVAGLNESEENELWPTLGERSGKKGSNVSRYWTSLKTRHQVLSNRTDKSEKEKVFHSLRRVILNELTKAGVDLVTIQSIVGHEPSLGASKSYLDEPVPLSMKKNAIEKLKCANVGWSQANHQ